MYVFHRTPRFTFSIRRALRTLSAGKDSEKDRTLVQRIWGWVPLWSSALIHHKDICSVFLTKTLVLLFQSLLANAEAAMEKYDEDKDTDRPTEDPGFKEQVSDMHFKAGQSKRVWGELYKVRRCCLHMPFSCDPMSKKILACSESEFMCSVPKLNFSSRPFSYGHCVNQGFLYEHWQRRQIQRFRKRAHHWIPSALILDGCSCAVDLLESRCI